MHAQAFGKSRRVGDKPADKNKFEDAGELQIKWRQPQAQAYLLCNGPGIWIVLWNIVVTNKETEFHNEMILFYLRLFVFKTLQLLDFIVWSSSKIFFYLYIKYYSSKATLVNGKAFLFGSLIYPQFHVIKYLWYQIKFSCFSPGFGNQSSSFLEVLRLHQKIYQS